jgi:class 3 adenylate cyclase
MSVGDPSRADVRVSDAERERAVALLRMHHAEGRLTLDEFTERVEEAYRARTNADLDRTLRELPREAVVPPDRQPPRRRPRRRMPMWWLRVNGICTAIWAVTTLGSGVHYFWPIWVMLGTAIPVVASAGHGHGHDHGHETGSTAPPEQPAPLPADATRVVSSVLFADIVESTEHAVSMGDREWNVVLEKYQQAVRTEITGFGGREVFTKGDEMVAAFATPAAAVRCGEAMRNCARSLELDIRAGVHAGEVDAHGHEIRGLAMHIGQRICAAAEPGQLLVSSTVRDLLAGSALTFTDAGEHELKGVPGPWRLYLYAVPG